MTPQNEQQSDPIVLFIAGSFRSGSTVLDNLLGQLEGFTSVGEMRSLWKNGLIDGRLCGCGEHVRDCAFWSDVLAAGFGDHPPDPFEVLAIQDAHLRTRPRQMAGLRRAVAGGPAPELRRYLSIVDTTYRAIAEVDGARVIVDSSKVPADAYALATMSELDVYVLHLVRDPRAVAYSASRAKPSPDDPNRASMVTTPPYRNSIAWMVWNGVLEYVVRRAAGDRYMRLRYEDFARDPRSATGEILRFIGVDDVELPFIGERTVRFEPTHGPSGNPDRLGRGQSEIRPKDSWRQGMTRTDRLIATVPAMPLMRSYGYPLGGGS